MAGSDLVNLSGLIDVAKYFALVRQHRWQEGACCPVCGSSAVIRDRHDDTQPCPQRTGAGRVRGVSTTSPERCWPGTTGRCGCGCCASTVAMVHDVSRSPGVVTPDGQCRHDGMEG